MRTYRELVYSVLDSVKIFSDDSVWETDHIVSVLTKYRALLFNQKYKGKKVEIPFANYQRLNVGFTTGITGTNTYKSTKQIPQILDITDLWKYTFISENGITTSNLNFINPHKFKYARISKWLSNQKYVTIDIDNFMYIKKSEITNTQTLQYDTILDNPIDGYRFNGNDALDVLDFAFPCEESLIQPIIDLCVKEIAAINGMPRDVANNATDDISIPKQQN